MAGRRGLLAAVTTFYAVVVLSLAAAACSSDGDDLDAKLEDAPSSTSTSSTTAETTTSTEATTTTLSEQAQAEADVAQLVTDYWFSPWDTSKNEYGAQYLTGAIAARSQETVERYTSQGQLAREIGQKSLEIRSVDVDLDRGVGEVEVCAGSYGEIVDLESLEQLAVEDPDYLTTSVYQLQMTEEGWKISELFASQATNTPEICEIGAQ